MYTRHDELPVLSAWPTRVPARPYNAALRALSRRGGPLRLDLPDLFLHDMIVQPGAWIVVDRGQADMPVAAWVDFAPAPDRGLHEPVSCELRYFHGAAGKVVAGVRTVFEDLLGSDAEGGPEGPADVLPFRPPDQA